MTWWNRATVEQKMTQIKAGIELGMTSKQIAMNLGAPIRTPNDNGVKSFADHFGLKFGKSHDKFSRAGRVGGTISGIVNSRRRGVPETFVSSAFDIFPRSEANEFAMLEGESA